MEKQIPFMAPVNDDNREYLKTKALKMGHTLKLDD